jgi:hypothetical protein
MIWLVSIKYNSLEWPNGLARASRQSVRAADEYKSRNPGGKPFAISEVDSVFIPELRSIFF